MQTLSDTPSSRALHHQIAQHLSGRIGREDGYHDRLPSEAALCRIYSVSRVTIRHALRHLENAGLVCRRQGRGTFVVPPADRNPPAHPVVGLSDILQARGMAVVTELLAFGLEPAPPEVARTLNLDDARALLMRRRYLIDAVPVAVTEVYYPPAFRAFVSENDARIHSSPRLMTEHIGLRLGRTHLTVDVIEAQPALAAELAMAQGSPVMVMRRVTCDDAGVACEHSTLLARPGIARFSITAHGGSLPDTDFIPRDPWPPAG
ncbi:GntR family transcriptional regulator [Komagataeibacter rhaeticus]|uniref:GntR family transcriptional regulator n=1 Tax=Komagataeibacter rhaeticus TaxID=215221 RepID=A0A181CAS4_9PROT|nr:GntR family transcriptional regulator [Komagataeibacter rhaeticus]KDU96631.1 transcriptional regulator [Komagataeibacter rhaeticus AF1]MBL7239254.1 GntR family transcriptional regulator [Komagataeibacter rhaeticus]QIP35408.1 GntR family transcriptional regulator [Komagataeibacter rhaeticus]QOC47978.1 GntR family transcriptional regulator [Komagataeibacter rhaeticus]WPP22559.1 GntR family transcriptional regulator [Komagataeibacter rhaeticus]